MCCIIGLHKFMQNFAMYCRSFELELLSLGKSMFAFNFQISYRVCTNKLEKVDQKCVFRFLLVALGNDIVCCILSMFALSDWNGKTLILPMFLLAIASYRSTTSSRFFRFIVQRSVITRSFFGFTIWSGFVQHNLMVLVVLLLLSK